MSHVDAGPLASYNSLLDPHLAGYFSNIRMRRHLIKSGLITRRGNIVSENTYRLNMARKEHKKHVRDLLAQAIVHKTLDMERMRQVAIKQKLEEIAKVEMVRRVKESCGRHGDEDILPYLKPPHKKGSRPSSVPSGGSGRKGHEEARPVSAPSKSHQKRSRSSGEHRPRIVVDDKGMPHSAQSRSYSGSTDSESRSHSANSRSKSASRYPTEELDDRHLYSLNSQTLRDYTMARYDMDSSRGPSPYRLPQLPPEMIPTPPSSRTPRSPRRPRHRGRSTNSQSKSTSASRSNKGQLMLHRQEPAMKHQERVQTLCDVNMHYFGNSLSLDYERFDPRDEVMVEQQHCGGNTLIVFREKILPGSDFTFTSRRHRGYPFSLTFYVNGVIDCRLSTCCEYKHQSGARLGGKQGHFGMIGVEGAAPCYKCQLNEANSQKKKKRRSRRKAKDTDEDQNVRVPVEEDDKVKDVKVRGIGEDQDRHVSKDDSVEVPVEDDQESTKDDIYEEDFEEEDSSSKDGKGEGRQSGSGSEDTRYSSEASQVEDGSHIDSHTSEDRKEVGQSSRSNHSAESHSSSTSTLRSRSSSESSSDSDSSYSSGQSSSASSQSGSKLETSKSDEEKRRSDEQSSRSDDGRQRSDGEQLSSDEKRSRSDADSSTLDEDRSRSGEDNSRADEKVQSDEELFSPRGEGSDYDIDLRYQRPIEVKVLCDEGDQPASKESEQQESGQRESDDSSPGSSSSDQEHAAPSLSSRRKKKLRRRHHLETKDKGD